MKKSVTVNFNLSNRAVYTLITFLILGIVGVGVYAYTGNVGHTSDQVDHPTCVAITGHVDLCDGSDANTQLTEATVDAYIANEGYSTGPHTANSFCSVSSGTCGSDSCIDKWITITCPGSSGSIPCDNSCAIDDGGL